LDDFSGSTVSFFPRNLSGAEQGKRPARLKKETRLRKEGEIVRKMKAAIAAGTDKAKAMSQAHAAGATFVAIGEVFGISSVRAYQIANGRSR